MVEFARRWDPLPIHLDDTAADAVFGHGGVNASGTFVLAVSMRLGHQLPAESFPAAVASFGHDEVRFHAPVRGGDVLRLDLEWADKRDSGSRPDCGIASAQVRAINQNGDTVMTRRDTLLVSGTSLPDPGS